MNLSIYFFLPRQQSHQQNEFKDVRLDKPVLFKDIKEQTVVFVVITAYYWKLNVSSVHLVCSNHAVVCWLLKLEHSVDLLVVG